jgi:hypothetical protein
MADIRKDLRYIFARQHTQEIIRYHGHFKDYLIRQVRSIDGLADWCFFCLRCQKLVVGNTEPVSRVFPLMETAHG